MRKSRSIPTLLASVWLIHAGFLCIVPPVDGNAESEPETCHIMDEWYPDEAGGTGRTRELPPARTCCDLTGKSDIAFQDAGGLDEPVVLTFEVPASDARLETFRSSAWDETVEFHAHAPPVFLVHSVFLI